VQRGDAGQAGQAVDLVRSQLDRLIAALSELQETGRRWSGVPSPSVAELAGAARAAAAWEARPPNPEPHATGPDPPRPEP
jgi:hypothetical protein